MTGKASMGIFWLLLGPALWTAVLLLVGSSEAGGTAHARDMGDQWPSFERHVDETRYCNATPIRP